MRLLLLAIASWILTSCTTTRYFYVAEEPIDLYEFPSFSGESVLTASIGDTVSTTGAESIQLGGKIPVEYRGYRFYSPSAKARFLRLAKVNKKRDAAVTGLAYAPRLRQSHLNKNEIINEEDTGEWYGQVTTVAPVLNEPISLAKTVSTLPKNAVVKIKRHNYNYWEVSVNGVTGYVGAFYILDYSRSDKPFVKTAYTGPTYYPSDSPTNYGYMPRTGTAYPGGSPSNYGYTPSTGAAIHVGPRGGQYYINSHGNKTYLSKSSSYRLGGIRSGGSSCRAKSTGSSSRSRSAGSSYRGSGRGRR